MTRTPLASLLPATSALLLACALLLAAGSASGATVSIFPDQGTYTVGQTATLSVLLDLEGVPMQSFEGRIEFDSALATGLDVTTSLDGEVSVPPPFPDCGVGFCDVFDHFLSTPVLDLVTATVTLSADAPGVVSIDWNPAPVFAASGTSFTIVPEPATSGLVAMGVAALAWAGRARRSGRERPGSR